MEPVLAKSGAAHETFLRRYLGKNDDVMGTYYRTLIFTGTGAMPRFLDSDAEIVRYVAKTKGAVGYVNIDFPTQGVKVLAIAEAAGILDRQLVTRVEPEYPQTLQHLLIGGMVRLEGHDFCPRKCRRHSTTGRKPRSRRSRHACRQAVGLCA